MTVGKVNTDLVVLYERASASTRYRPPPTTTSRLSKYPWKSAMRPLSSRRSSVTPS